jgi:hypothetical protein
VNAGGAVGQVLKGIAAALVGLAALSCNGTTGDAIITFPAYASGAAGAAEPFSSNGYTIVLTKARMYIGAVYVNEAPPGSSFASPVCTNPGVYAAQVPAGVDVDLLSTARQPFPLKGNGTADLGQSWELWLTDGDVNSASSSRFGVPNVVDLQGTATRDADGAAFSFAATVNINQDNRGVPGSDPAQPGLNPICKQRIVALGGIALQLSPGGALVVRVDPRGWFNQAIDFSTLPSVASRDCSIDPASVFGDAKYCIPDSSNLPGSDLGAQQGVAIYTGILTAGPAAYSIAYEPVSGDGKP